MIRFHSTVRLALLMSLVLVLAGSGALQAATFHVATAGDDSNDCLSPGTPCKTIQGAVDKSVDGDAVEIAAGVYAEEISIQRRSRLTLRGVPGTVLVPPSSAGEPRLINVFLSDSIRLEGLTLTGNGTADFAGGIALSQSYAIEIDRCTVQDLGGGGIVLFQNSTATVRASQILRNRFHGLRIDQGSQAVVVGSPLGAAPTVVADNLFAGVILTGGVAFRGAVLLRGNQYGVLGEGGDVATCCGEDALTIRGNLIGLSMRGGHLQLRGPAFVEENQFVGVRLNAASGSFGRFSEARVVVRNNGQPGDATSAGILLTGSHLDLFLADVVDNRSRGVLLQDNSSVRLSDTVVIGNQAEGLRLENLSTARLFSPSVLKGNGGFDLSCTPNSAAAGDDQGIGRRFCPGFDRAPSPGSP